MAPRRPTVGGDGPFLCPVWIGACSLPSSSPPRLQAPLHEARGREIGRPRPPSAAGVASPPTVLAFRYFSRARGWPGSPATRMKAAEREELAAQLEREAARGGAGPGPGGLGCRPQVAGRRPPLSESL